MYTNTKDILYIYTLRMGCLEVLQLGTERIKVLSSTSQVRIVWTILLDNFQFCKGVTSEGNLKHIEVECLEAVDNLIKKKTVAYDNLIYLYLNKAPCADYNGNRKNCLDKVIKWAKSNPTRKLVLGFRRPYAIGSFTERGSWHRPDKVMFFLKGMPLKRLGLKSTFTNKKKHF